MLTEEGKADRVEVIRRIRFVRTSILFSGIAGLQLDDWYCWYKESDIWNCISQFGSSRSLLLAVVVSPLDTVAVSDCAQRDPMWRASLVSNPLVGLGPYRKGHPR